MTTLARCPSCSTHIRVDETACPFCSMPSVSSRVIAAIRLVSIIAIAGCAYGLPPADAAHPSDSHVVDGHPGDAGVVDSH